MDERLVVNRTNWNERTPVHAASAFYDVEGFRADQTTLREIELREVGRAGHDVVGAAGG